MTRTFDPVSALRAHAICSGLRFGRRRAHSVIALLVPGILVISSISSADPASSTLDQQFTHTVRPFVAQYCGACHSGAKPAGQLDLKAYNTMEAVVRDHPRWTLVMERLTAKEMPPQAMPQPTAEARRVPAAKGLLKGFSPA